MNTHIYTAAVIGLGRIAWSSHLPNLTAHPEQFKVTTVVDPHWYAMAGNIWQIQNLTEISNLSEEFVKKSSDAANMLLHSMLSGIDLCHSLTRSDFSPKNSNIAAEAADYFSQNIGFFQSVEKTARKFGLSRSHFTKIFTDFWHVSPQKDGTVKTHNLSFCGSRKSEICKFSTVTAKGSRLKLPNSVFSAIHPKSGVGIFGSAVQKYQIHLRIERAKHLLSETRLSVSEIAASLGYTEPFFFSRQFKKVVNMTPSEYREGNKNNLS